MTSNWGLVEKIASSGLIWSGEMTTDIRSLFFKSLKSAKSSITISAFSMGNKNSDVIEFFEIIQNKLLGRKKVMIIANDDENLKKFSRTKLLLLSENFPEDFTLRLFDPKRGGKHMILHSKLTIIDRKFALVGSANISRQALEHNYEMMIKISGKSVSMMDDMMIRLSQAIEEGDNY
jgi:phosphatidylserine/phosphatidylglycerophosphate/cardiolipin synthase-like enzyme